jgi:hypothetical protein
VPVWVSAALHMRCVLLVMFFSDYDIDRIAYGSWLWDQEHGLTDQSWERAKDLYRDRGEFVVKYMNKLETLA